MYRCADPVLQMDIGHDPILILLDADDAIEGAIGRSPRLGHLRQRCTAGRHQDFPWSR